MASAEMVLSGWIVGTNDLGSNTDGIPLAVVEKTLTETGKYGVTRMRTHTMPHDATGRLTDSVMYKTQKHSSGVDGEHQEDALPDVTEPDTAYIGSNDPSSYYRENGSGIHKTKEGSDLFIERMKEWCAIRGIDDVWAVINGVRNSKTEAEPFVSPEEKNITEYGNKRLTANLLKWLWKQQRSGRATKV